MLQCYMQLFGHRWSRVAGNFTGTTLQGTVLAHDPPDLRTAMTELNSRIHNQFRQGADYGKIAQCRQKEGEDPSGYMDQLRPVFRANSAITHSTDEQGAYQQQLK
ncbi:hypothetical protein ATANTOWER_030679 [Ataeniobius toweri]|uniref:Gag protein n=1 Tax=Ataeniobius toweri TaxID=208326 RepID=A0ABU7C1M0_9TELE|nr:hypothetical protein [Ataeniobius toweri]